MNKFATIKSLRDKADSKIVLIVLDGLGGLPGEQTNQTELEFAQTPHLDELASQGITGLHTPVASGITPGSGPGHLGVFGYDPIEFQIGRGVLSALGIDFDLGPNDVAVRGNFCTIDNNGKVTDRRAGRISTEKNRVLCEMLQDIELNDAKLFIETIKEHRFLMVLRGKDLSGDILATDPQKTGVAPLAPEPQSGDARRTAELVQSFIGQAGEVLSGEGTANMVLLRGFSKRPKWPLFPDVFGMRSAAIAAYPMYRGLSRLLGMEILETGETIEDEMSTLEKHFDDYDFFFVHYKPTDSAGEEGDFDRKVNAIERMDNAVAQVKRLSPDVIVVTGDHSTPSVMRSHSWHPVPLLVWSKWCRPDSVTQFGERACLQGGLGARLPATNIMPIALSNAGRLQKFGA